MYTSDLYTTSTTDVTVDNVAPTADLANNGPKDEGSPATVSFSNQLDPSSVDAAAGFHYEYHCDGGLFGPVDYTTAGSDASHDCTFADNGVHQVRARIIHKDNGYTTYTTDVTVDNVAPTTPNLLAPDDNALTSDATPTFDWTDSTDPAGANDTITYSIQADNNGCAFPSPEVNASGLSSSTFTP